jgi:hypothetical protein
MLECLKESVVSILKYKVDNEEVNRENCSLVSLNDASHENIEGLITCL